MEGIAIAEGAEPSIHGALLASRQRWREMVLLGADFAFETDRQGRFTMLEPDRVLGHAAATLLGRDGSALAMGADPGPFARMGASRAQRTWVAAADGSAHCLSITTAVLKDGMGTFAGLRGIARDVTAEAARDAETEAALRCLKALPGLIEGPGGLRGVLDRARTALQAAGAALINDEDAEPELLAGAMPSASVMQVVLPALEGRHAVFAAGLRAEPVALAPVPLEGMPRGLALWRNPGAQGFAAAERAVMLAVAAHVAASLRLQMAERTLESLSQTDPMTGLMNRHAFLAELNRRLERMAIAGGGGVLLLADPGGLRAVNAERGSEAGDAVMRAVAAQLRLAQGSADLAGRLDDGAALWLGGQGAEDAALHAQALCDWAEQGGVQPAISLRVGVAALADEPANAETLLGRAEAALDAARRTGGTGWRLWKAPPA